MLLRLVYEAICGEPDDCQSGACECAGDWTDAEFAARIIGEIEARRESAPWLYRAEATVTKLWKANELADAVASLEAKVATCQAESREDR